MLRTINQLRQEVFQHVYDVFDIFKNFFGEEHVDLQHIPTDNDIAFMLEDRNFSLREDGSYEGDGRKFASVRSALSNIKPFILVWWPTVKITNEHNRSIVIQDLYAKIELTSGGFIPTANRGFLLNRATYSIEQWACNYMHSHISSIPKSGIHVFQTPCTGTGPINGTIISLKADTAQGFDETMWMLFCEELDRYVTVESLRGIPYNKLESVHLTAVLDGYNGFNNLNWVSNIVEFNEKLGCQFLPEFIRYYLKNGHLAINFQNGSYVCGMSYFNYMIDISNAFINYFNSTVTDKMLVSKVFGIYERTSILLKAVAVGDRFYNPYKRSSIPNTQNYQGLRVCTFKGKEIRLRITDAVPSKPEETTLLNHGVAMFILNNILRIINYHYTNDYTRKQSSASTAETTPTARQRVYYL